MFEIVFVDECPVLHPLFIDNISSNGELSQYVSTPLTELCGANRVCPITDGNNIIQIIVFGGILYYYMRQFVGISDKLNFLVI